MARATTSIALIVALIIGIVIGIGAAPMVMPPSPPVGGVTTTLTATVTSTVTAGPVQKTSLTIRAVFQTPISEPWDGAIHVAILAIVDEYKAKGISIDYKFVDRKVDPKEYELSLIHI